MYVVFDIGGTKTRLGTSRDGETIERTVIIETPVSYEAGLIEIKQAASALLAGEAALAVGGCIAGPFSQKKNALVRAPHLRDWVGRPFGKELEGFFNAPVYVENDAVLAGLGEATHGAGKGFEIVAYITVSTGVGGARIVHGKVDEKSIGFEPGHQIIDVDRTILPDAQGIYFEDFVSGTSVAKRTGKKPKEITEPIFWDGMAKILAYGLNNTIVHWSPDVVVIGGSMITGDPVIPLETVERYLKEILKIYPEIPAIKKAELGDIGGLYGGLEYIKQNLTQNT